MKTAEIQKVSDGCMRIDNLGNFHINHNEQRQ